MDDEIRFDPEPIRWDRAVWQEGNGYESIYGHISEGNLDSFDPDYPGIEITAVTGLAVRDPTERFRVQLPLSTPVTARLGADAGSVVTGHRTWAEVGWSLSARHEDSAPRYVSELV